MFLSRRWKRQVLEIDSDLDCGKSGNVFSFVKELVATDFILKIKN